MGAHQAASYNQWRSYVRLGRSRFGEGDNIGPLYREYLEAVEAYGGRWQAAQGRCTAAYNRAVADGLRTKGQGKEKKGQGRKPVSTTSKREREKRDQRATMRKLIPLINHAGVRVVNSAYN